MRDIYPGGFTMQLRRCLLIALAVAVPTASFADFRYDETTKITGGSLVSMTKLMGAFSKNARQITDPVNSTILVKGNRKAHITKDSTEIIDLDHETITNIDHVKKQYSVTTFQEMKAAMEEAAKKAQQQQAQPQAPQQATPPPSGPPPEMHFKVSVNNTGLSKPVAGLSAKQTILKMSLEAKDKQSGQSGNMAMNNDMWMVPEIPGYSEIHDFDERMAAKMERGYSDAMPALMTPQTLQAQPGMFTGMSDMAKEMSKLHGVPVSQVMRMGSTTDGSFLPADSEAALPQSNGPNVGQAASSAATDAATSTAENKITSKMGLPSFGGFGGFHKKKDQQQAAQQPPAQTWAVLMETSIEMTNFSSASIDPALFNVPSGYTKVPSEYQKAHQ
ncbi:MAG: hypothetical protein JOZ80_07065 [Acidobacteriaceae bacterium]|nr:hypothetical protein [Acidobacteriaceae bacterium]